MAEVQLTGSIKDSRSQKGRDRVQGKGNRAKCLVFDPMSHPFQRQVVQNSSLFLKKTIGLEVIQDGAEYDASSLRTHSSPGTVQGAFSVSSHLIPEQC